MGKKSVRVLIGFGLALVLLATACSSEDSTTSTEGTSATSTDDAGGGGDASSTINVPEDYETIQEAVNAADEGSLILIGPGTYNEAVDVTTDNLVIRGLDRNEVVLDGEFELENGIRVLDADGVVVENMTAQNYTKNGFFWTTNIDGYRGSYLTAIRNGDYGVYAFGARNGVFEKIYASGSPDAGIYIGQCFPCNALIDDVVSEYNGLGYSGTNSGGNLIIVNSTWRNNRAGIVPNSGSYEGCAPERDTTVVGNLVYDNTNSDTSAIDAAITAQGNGIIVPGGLDNLIERNRIWNHEISGIALVPFPEDNPIAPIPEDPPTDCLVGTEVPAEGDPALPESIFWPAGGNIVRSNVITDSGVADLILVSAAEFGNQFCDNDFTTSEPADIETVAPCDGVPAELGLATALMFLDLVEQDRPASVPYEEVDLPDPGPQDNMPDAATAAAKPATDVPYVVDVDAIGVPDMPVDE